MKDIAEKTVQIQFYPRSNKIKVYRRRCSNPKCKHKKLNKCATFITEDPEQHVCNDCVEAAMLEEGFCYREKEKYK